MKGEHVGHSKPRASALQTGFDPFNPIRWRTYRSGNQSQIRSARTFVIRSEADWQGYWAQSTGNQPQTAPRDIDWNKELLVAVHLGTRNTGGYSVQVNSVRRARPAEVVVKYTELTPSPDDIVTQVITSPWTIARMDRTAGSITFEKGKRVGSPLGDVTIIQTCGCCHRCRPVVIDIMPVIPVSVPVFGGFPLEQGQGVAWRPLDSGAFSNIAAFQTRVISTEGDWQQYWVRHSGNPAHTAPRDIDWGREQLVAINLGKMPAAGYEVFVESVQKVQPNDVQVNYVVLNPRAGRAQASLSASPYTIIRMERAAGNVQLQRRESAMSIVGSGAVRCGCGCSHCGCGH